jgi:alkylated DNA repair protein (DNA oxidative demethylase)
MFEVAFTLSFETQIELLNICRQIAEEAPLFQKSMPNGAKFNYLCTSAGDYGWVSDRRGYRYEEQHPVTNQPFPKIPSLIEEIAIKAAGSYGLSLRPESALINWYSADSSLGLHQDKTERSDAPVISISLGDDCVFMKGGITRSEPKENLMLYSGDVLVMGGEHRYYFHGVKKIYPNSAPIEIGMKSAGRINITVRQVNP